MVELTEEDEDDHPDPDIDLTTAMPVLEDGACGIDIVWGDDEVFQEVIVSKSESDSRVHETGRIACETALVWNVGGHFTERNHDEVAHEANEAVAKEKAERTTTAKSRDLDGREGD